MTAPLPTREWLAGFLGRFHAKALTNPSAWVEFVDELEARLRPALEESYYARLPVYVERDALRASLARKDEALRACVKTLEHVALVNHMHCITVADQLSDLPHSGDFGSCPAPSCDEARTILLARAQEAGR